MKSPFNMLQVKRKASAVQEFPDPPTIDESGIDLARGKIDGRRARNTFRKVQFNTKVRQSFFEAFNSELVAEGRRMGKALAKADFLELMLSVWRREKNKEPLRPFGLSETALKGAEAISEKMGWSLAEVVEDAIAQRCREIGVAGKEKAKRA